MGARIRKGSINQWKRISIYIVVSLSLVTFTLGCGNIDLRDYITEKVALYELSQKPGEVYVSTTGDDNNSGTKENPLKSIQMAIDLGNSLYKTTDVRVAGGTYYVNYNQGTHIVMREGVSLWGGYSSDFSSRDPLSYVTTIEDQSSSSGTAQIPTCAVDGGAV